VRVTSVDDSELVTYLGCTYRPRMFAARIMNGDHPELVYNVAAWVQWVAGVASTDQLRHAMHENAERMNRPGQQAAGSAWFDELVRAICQADDPSKRVVGLALLSDYPHHQMHLQEPGAGTWAELTLALFHDPSPMVRAAAIRGMFVRDWEPNMLRAVFDDPDMTVRLAAYQMAWHKQPHVFPDRDGPDPMGEEDAWVVAAWFAEAEATPDQLAVLAGHRAYQVRQIVAAIRDTPPEAVKGLLDDEHPEVVAWALSRSDAETVKQYIDDPRSVVAERAQSRWLALLSGVTGGDLPTFPELNVAGHP
jgi:hypothetical protein